MHGNPGYINLCDALNSWMLVKEARKALGAPAAASFKHVSPAGAAIAVPLTEAEMKAYEITDPNMSGAALAYLRARNADPMSSFGDFAAISEVVDVPAAKYISTCISVLAQRHNDVIPSKEQMGNVVTENKTIPDCAMNDMVLGNICLKYTQSNSVGYALNGQMIGVGAGQQSRIDCVKLAVGSESGSNA